MFESLSRLIHLTCFNGLTINNLSLGVSESMFEDQELECCTLCDYDLSLMLV